MQTVLVRGRARRLVRSKTRPAYRAGKSMCCVAEFRMHADQKSCRVVGGAAARSAETQERRSEEGEDSVIPAQQVRAVCIV